MGAALAACGLAAALCVGAGMGAGTPALAAEARAAVSGLDKPHEIDLGYSVTGAGFSLLTADINIKLDRRRYQAVTVVKTDGIAGLMMESRWDSVAEGDITPTGLSPSRYRIDVATRQGRGAVQVKYDGDKHTITAIPKNKPERMADLERNLTSAMPDPLSAIITAALFSANRPCTGSQRAFDGRRIHDLEFKFDRSVIMKGGGYYEGPALRCQVKHTPIAGQPPDELEEERRSPSPYHALWLAPVILAKGAPTVLIPVKIEVAGGWGTTVVNLVRSSVDGRAINVARAASN
jgi:hypothetical protein